MGYAQHIGRVGALAVAMGVGSAIAFPQTAFADEDAGSNTTSVSRDSTSTSDTDTDTATTSHARATTADGVSATTTSSTDTTPSTTAEGAETKERASTTVSVGDSPKVTISAQTNTSREAQDKPDALPNDIETPAPADLDIADLDTDAQAPLESGIDLGVPADPEVKEPPLEVPSPAPTEIADNGGGRALDKDSEEHAAPQPLSQNSATHESETSSTPQLVSTFSAEEQATTFAASTNAAPALPQASITVTAPPPPVAPLQQIVRSIVVSVLGLFGFNPAPGVPNNPLLEALWGVYRRIESAIWNEAPTIRTAQVIGTSLTDDGKLAVTLDVDFDDYNGDPLTYTTTNGAKGTLSANTDGTYTYLTDADTVGTDTVTITAADTGFHLHGLGRLFGGGHTTTASISVTITAAPSSAVIDTVTSTPGTGNTWTVTVTTLTPTAMTSRSHWFPTTINPFRSPVTTTAPLPSRSPIMVGPQRVRVPRSASPPRPPTASQHRSAPLWPSAPSTTWWPSATIASDRPASPHCPPE
ncbi:Ig-like domain-containing protein [Mycolicibacterium celeriflavum]|uniref:Ig-like domain-containing protein n=1 Tax=Mycolicibacterium celeriflavum TaxID=1249101 RepID=UPI003CF562CA